MSNNPSRLSKGVAQAAAHLANVDPILASIISEIGPLDLRRRLEAPADDHFGALTACLVGQRQSEHDTIRQLGVLRQKFGRPFLTPPEILSLPETELARILNSHKKATYVRDLAQTIVDGTRRLEDLDRVSDEEVTTRLLTIKGVGAWSVEQILFWHLERPDIFVTGDPAVRRALCKAYQLAEFPKGALLETISTPWQPYRSYVAHLLLRSNFGPGISEAWPRKGRPM